MNESMPPRRLGGDGSLNLPYEDVPDPAPRPFAAPPLLASGMICKAAAIEQPEIGLAPIPVLIFQFAVEGTLTREIVLVVEPDELRNVVPLVASAVEGALMPRMEIP